MSFSLEFTPDGSQWRFRSLLLGFQLFYKPDMNPAMELRCQADLDDGSDCLNTVSYRAVEQVMLMACRSRDRSATIHQGHGVASNTAEDGFLCRKLEAELLDTLSGMSLCREHQARHNRSFERRRLTQKWSFSIFEETKRIMSFVSFVGEEAFQHGSRVGNDLRALGNLASPARKADRQTPQRPWLTRRNDEVAMERPKSAEIEVQPMNSWGDSPGTLSDVSEEASPVFDSPMDATFETPPTSTKIGLMYGTEKKDQNLEDVLEEADLIDFGFEDGSAAPDSEDEPVETRETCRVLFPNARHSSLTNSETALNPFFREASKASYRSAFNNKGLHTVKEPPVHPVSSSAPLSTKVFERHEFVPKPLTRAGTMPCRATLEAVHKFDTSSIVGRRHSFHTTDDHHGFESAFDIEAAMAFSEKFPPEYRRRKSISVNVTSTEREEEVEASSEQGDLEESDEDSDDECKALTSHDEFTVAKKRRGSPRTTLHDETRSDPPTDIADIVDNETELKAKRHAPVKPEFWKYSWVNKKAPAAKLLYELSQFRTEFRNPNHRHYIYGYKRGDCPAHIKIGYAASARKRVAQWAKCRAILEHVFTLEVRSEGLWAERLMHLDMFDERRKTKCSHCKGKKGENVVHEEWFEVTSSRHEASLELWKHFHRLHMYGENMAPLPSLCDWIAEQMVEIGEAGALDAEELSVQGGKATRTKAKTAQRQKADMEAVLDSLKDFLVKEEASREIEKRLAKARAAGEKGKHGAERTGRGHGSRLGEFPFHRIGTCI